MSLTLALCGKSSLLAANYFPAIDLHIKNCALQNVFKIHNWWSQCQKNISSLKNKI
ncbi:hypothetical protein ALC57_17421 [Trachymyrmex cornetzi]|uniref:Uncharacterized protein n=1 Tax=Trachymyrmex cornetzi TaxID=471704 RepID=A0A151ITP7_9HYME|nr:hypothetical protein ALC57_17421 [Trachymyrmex cornetzi]